MEKEMKIGLLLVLILISFSFFVYNNRIFVLASPTNITEESLQHLWIRNTLIDNVISDSTHGLVYFVGNYGLFAVYNRTSNITEDLRGVDVWDWIGTNSSSSLYGLVYNPNNGLVYFSGGMGVFGAYNRTSNTIEDLRETDNFIGNTDNDIIYTLSYDNNSLIYLGGYNLFGAYDLTLNKTENLNETDTGNWLGSQSSIRDITYSSHDNLTYIAGSGAGGASGVFGIYNRTSNITEDLRAADTGDWISTSIINKLAYDPDNKIIYLLGTNAVFGIYNRTSNITEDLRAVDIGGWVTGILYGLAYSSQNKLVYFSGAEGKFGLYNRTSNVSENLNMTDPEDWVGSNGIWALTYDSIRNNIYLVGASGVWGIYDRTSNVTTDLNLPNDWVRYRKLNGLIYNSNNNLIYFGGDSGIFGDYNEISNVKGDLRETDAGNWIGKNNIYVFTYNSNHNLVYFAGGDASSPGLFAVYNRTSNITEDLRGVDAGNWIGNKRIYGLTYDSNKDFVYLTGESGLFGIYNRTLNSIENLSTTDSDNWITSDIRVVAYNSYNNLVYLADSYGGLAVYNRTSNVTENLNTSDPGNWVGTQQILGLVCNPNNGLVYFGASGSVFGVYNRTSNVSENLNSTSPTPIVGVIYALVYSSHDDLVYFSGNGGIFAVYNRTSNKTEDLRGTDTGNWIGTDIIYGLTYNSQNKLIYLAGDNGIFGIYNRTSNTTMIVTEESGLLSGGADLLSATTQTETQSVNIIAGGSASIEIRNPYIDIRNITLSAKTNISDASITVSNNETGNIRLKFPTGTVYQAFSISTRAISNENLNNVTIEFRVNKTWLEENNRSVDDVVLYRVPSSQEVWEALITTSIREDSTYYYFLALSPGFSTFVVFVGESGTIGCTPSQKRCFNDELQVCNENGIWTAEEQCQYKCENAQCIKTLFGWNISVSIYYGILVVVSLGVVVTLYFLMRVFKKKRGAK